MFAPYMFQTDYMIKYETVLIMILFIKGKKA